ncbi:MAG: hypothetical protein QM780_12320 [Hyphomicrobium sp.]|uniref:hypothetical protein n=1 Tax=Hyphomicrobium sp. TaxID=82 RepID=UPI0039E6FADA
MATDDRPPAEWDADAEHPAARFAADCALQLDICKSLLAVADSLPGSLNPTTIDVLSKLVQSTWSSHLTLQSQAILPLISQRHEHLHERFVPLTRQHIEISGINDELVECFDMVSSGEHVDRGMLGYLIRNAAERRREHVDWEKVLLGPLLPQTLSPAERQRFSDWVAANPWPVEGLRTLSSIKLN